MRRRPARRAAPRRVRRRRIRHTPTPTPAGSTLAGDADQLKQAGVERVTDRSDGLVVAVGGHRVLGQVVSADGQEVDMTGERRCLERGRGHLDHHADLKIGRSLPAGPADCLIQKPSRREQFVECADHREHHTDRCVMCEPHHRQQLIGHQPGMGQRQPDAPDAEERVRLGGCRQELQRLVTADVEGAQRDRASVKRFGNLAVDGELLLDSGAFWRPRNKNSVRTRPAKSAPCTAAARRRRRTHRRRPER